MELQFFNLVGVREDKTVDEAIVLLEPTRGNFRISPQIAKALDITDGSFITVQKAEVDGEVKVFIGKGKDGVIAKDENGKDKVDGRGRKIYEQDGFGASVREVRPGSNIYRFSVTAAWDALGGNTDKRMYFTIGEPTEVNIPVGEGDFFTTTLFPLTFAREEDKLVRGSSSLDSSDEEEQATAEVVGEQAATQAFEEDEL